MFSCMLPSQRPDIFARHRSDGDRNSNKTFMQTTVEAVQFANKDLFEERLFEGFIGSVWRLSVMLRSDIIDSARLVESGCEARRE